MRLVLFYTFFFLYIFKGFSQTEYFNKRIDLGYVEAAYSIVLADSGYAISGAISQPGNWHKLALTFTDFNGDFLKVKYYEADGHLYPGRSNALSNTKDKGFILATTLQNKNLYEDLLFRFDSNGDTLWTKSVGADTTLDFAGTQIKELENGNLIYLVLGSDITNDYYRIYLTMLDNNGNQIWDKTYGSGVNHYKGYSLDVCNDKGFIIGGQRTIGRYEHPYILKVDSMGNVQWEKTFGTNYTCRYTHCFSGTAYPIQLANGDFFIAEYEVIFQANNGIDYNKSRFIRLNPQGETIWDYYYGPVQLYNYMGFPVELEDGSIICGGQELNYLNKSVGTIFKLSSAGDSLWWRNYYGQPIDSTANNYLRSIKSTNAGGIVGAGFVTKPQDIWIFKVDSMGCEIPLCHVDTTVGIIESAKKDFAFKVYPNPSAGLFNFEYDLLGENEGRLSIYNALGAMVKQEKLLGPAGKMQVEINGSSGSIFFYTFELKGAIVGKGKLILVK
ncbi:MAG: hypothetical protein H0X62_07090 [Bacteroidetes bacterium]|nr:hypothetical protein [Bacteroidota bacterium]